jgi:hypothetical protein
MMSAALLAFRMLWWRSRRLPQLRGIERRNGPFDIHQVVVLAL